MSMEITNNYSSYAKNYTAATKRAGSNTTAEVKSATSASSKDKVQDYYEALCRKFPEINFNTNGGTLPSNSRKVTVNLSYDCLKKMADDPEFAKEMEWNLSGEAAANAMVYGCAQRDGVVLGGRTVTYDANGNRQSSCGGMRTANAGNEHNYINQLQKKYKKEEDHYLKARKKREEKEKIAKRREEKRIKEEAAARRRAERKEAGETGKEKDEYTMNTTDTDLKEIAGKAAGMSLDISALTGAGLDLKV